jgi:hypothetical protein
MNDVCIILDDVFTLLSAQKSFRGLVQASLTLFRLLGRESHRLDCSYWSDQLYMYFVMEPEAFLACCSLRLECLRLILPKLFRRVYLASSLIFVVTEAFIEEFTSYLL